jgi:hypothetical protein
VHTNLQWNEDPTTTLALARLLIGFYFFDKPIGFFMQYGNPGAAKNKKIFIWKLLVIVWLSNQID